MSSIKSITIENIDFDDCNPHYISDALYLAEFATVSRITIVEYKVWCPCEDISITKYRAYVEIHEWHDTEAAYNMVAMLKEYNNMPFIHRVGPYDSIWTLSQNKDVLITRDALYKEKTTVFYLVDEKDGFYGNDSDHELEEKESFRRETDKLCPTVSALNDSENVAIIGWFDEFNNDYSDNAFCRASDMPIPSTTALNGLHYERHIGLGEYQMGEYQMGEYQMGEYQMGEYQMGEYQMVSF